MERNEFKNLQPGDIVRHKPGPYPDSRTALIVTGNYGDRVTAVQTHDLTNPSEWDLVLKVEHRAGETLPKDRATLKHPVKLFL